MVATGRHVCKLGYAREPEKESKRARARQRESETARARAKERVCMRASEKERGREENQKREGVRRMDRHTDTQKGYVCAHTHWGMGRWERELGEGGGRGRERYTQGHPTQEREG